MSEDTRERPKRLSEYQLMGKSLSEATQVVIRGDEKDLLLVLFYQRPDQEPKGAEFLVLDLWKYDKNGATYIRYCEGNAAFDGIRHIYWGKKWSDGYMYYPDFEMLREVLELLEREFPDHVPDTTAEAMS